MLAPRKERVVVQQIQELSKLPGIQQVSDLHEDPVPPAQMQMPVMPQSRGKAKMGSCFDVTSGVFPPWCFARGTRGSRARISGVLEANGYRVVISSVNRPLHVVVALAQGRR